MREMNPQLWFGEREITHVPPHFKKAPTPLSNESLNWVNSKLTGRYSLSTLSEHENFIFESRTYIYFEDSGDAMMYELRWSGSENNSRLI